MANNSFDARSTFSVNNKEYTYFRLDALDSLADVETLPKSIKILLENLLRHEDGIHVQSDDIVSLANWSPEAAGAFEIAFSPERVLMQDFTGVPAVADLAAMRDAILNLGGDPKSVNPLVPVELVIDHSVIVEKASSSFAFEENAEIEASRNRERYALLRWAQQAFDGVRVVPPDAGICHQVNLEYLARVVFTANDGTTYPDTVVGTDSHTTMINGLGVLGWGVGGIEAEAAMLGQPVTMLVPPVVGVNLVGQLSPGVTATDLVLTVCEMLRKHGVVGKFVEFMGEGLRLLSLESRATIANMAPEYGATCGFFPIDQVTLDYLSFTGRSADQVEIIKTYAKLQGLFVEDYSALPRASEYLELDLTTIIPSLAGPSRPQDRVALSGVKEVAAKASGSLKRDETLREVQNGDVVIAAITSCTNTSNPQVLVAAGLLAKKARERGLSSPPWVKASLAPGSRVVTDYLDKAGLTKYLEELGFYLVGYGCTTCIGNSGPLNDGTATKVVQEKLSVAAVLSGNRNFEGRVHPDVRLNFLASPPLVVAYAIAGTTLIDLTSEPLGKGSNGEEVFLSDIWPSESEINDLMRDSIEASMYKNRYDAIFEGDLRWQSLNSGVGDHFSWDEDSTYVKRPLFFEGITMELPVVRDITGARVLVKVGDSVTTDHISPAGSIKKTSPAGVYLTEHGVAFEDFNSYGSRRGNHDVMMRGTFANVRLKNQLVPNSEGNWTRYLPTNEECTIFEASEKYRQDGTPLIVLAGKEYGTGSSRDWAAKGVLMLGVRVVIAESFERIHRSNLVGMGIVPLQFEPGVTIESLGLSGEEIFETIGLEAIQNGELPKKISVKADAKEFETILRVDTPVEATYLRNGGILQYVLRQLARN
ncbi:MAG: aconitate hydratase AcnA [Acidimicrobiales bacterium]|nr:aconitate hydratase AcnA [Acidimicrobiales bacterium]